MKITKIIYPLAIILLLGNASCSLFKSSTKKDGIVLKYGLSVGQDILVKNETESKIITEQMGQSISTDLNSSATYVFTTKSVNDDNSMNIEVEFKGMSQSMESSMGSGDTDFSELIGKTAGFKLSDIGVADNTKGFEDLPEITTVSGETVGGEMYEQVMKATFIMLPDHPVKIGDTWTQQDTTNMPLGEGNLETISKAIYIITEKLEVDGNECFKVDITSTSTTKGEFEQGGTQLVMERKSTSTGLMVFDYTRGMYTSMEIASKTEGIIDVPAAGMTIPQNITTNTKTTVEFK